VPANWKALFKFNRLKQNMAEGMEFADAARKAGYSQTTIDRKAEELRERLGRAAKVSAPTPAAPDTLQIYRNQLKPGPASRLPEWAQPKPDTKPAVRPFVPVTIEHPVFGEGRKSANGGFVPGWCGEEFSGGDYNTGSLPTPGARSESAWAKLQADQDRLARSYSRPETPTRPPLIYPDEADKAEELPGRGFKDQGRDILQEALDGRFGFAEIPIRGE